MSMTLGGYQGSQQSGGIRRQATQQQNRQQEKLAQSEQKTQQLLQQAEQARFPQEKLLATHQALEEMRQAVAQDSGKSSQVKNAQLTSLDGLLKDNQATRSELDRAKKLKNAQYTRAVTQVEEHLMDNLIADLAHPEPEMAKSARERLLKLGVQEKLLDTMTRKLREEKAKHSSKSVRFGGGKDGGGASGGQTSISDSLKDLMQAAKQQITQYSSMKDIVNAGCDQQLESIQHHVHPLLFGSGAWVTTDYDHNGYPVVEWSNNGP